MSQVQLFRRDQFVFVDETGCKSKDHMRRFGYALRGKALFSMEYSTKEAESLQ